MARVLALSAASPYVNAASALHLLCLGRFDEALRRIRATIQSHPDYASAYGELARAYEATGDFGAALAVYEKIDRESGGTDIEAIAARGHCLGVAGRRVEALGVLRQLEAIGRERYVSPYQFAIVDLGLGDSPAALREVLRAWDDRSLWLPGLRGDPRLEPIRTEPEFQKLLKSISLMPVSRLH
jgi:tetratricopeptide (TPR) repeat protein